MQVSSRHLIRWFFADFQRSFWEWLEVLFFTLGTWGMSYWLNPENPYYAQSAFPWPLLAPVILALRYGVGAGLVSMGLYVGIYYFGIPHYFPAIPDSKSFFLGELLVVLLCGEFSSSWRTRLRRRDEISHYMDEKLDQLTHRYYLLRLSHDRLEQSLVTRPMSLRDALTQLHQIVQEKDSDILPGAPRFLGLIGQYCQVEQAALYSVVAETSTKKINSLTTPAVAYLGEPYGLVHDDPMVQHALTHQKICHVQSPSANTGQGKKEPVDANHPTYLIAAPIQVANQAPLGLLLVNRMPFIALQQETIQVLAVLCGYYADLLTEQQQGKSLQNSLPGCPVDFMSELQRLHRLYISVGMSSSLVALRFMEHPRRPELFQQISRQRRTLDLHWAIQTPEKDILMTLMPLAGMAAIEGYQDRMNTWLKQHYGVGLVDLNIYPHSLMLGEEAPETTVAKLLASCDITLPTSKNGR